MSVRMKDVAAHAGVSVATVSNVFTGKHCVSPDVKEKILKAVEELDYHVNLNARGLKTSRTNTIGVILPDITKLFFTGVMRGIQSEAGKHGFRIVYLSSNYDFNTEKECVAQFRGSNVDAIIIDSCCDYLTIKEWAYELATYNGRYTPIVFLENSIDDGLVSSISIDAYSWSGKLTQHFLSLGKKEILYISGPQHLRHEHDRLQGYMQALKENNIEISDSLILESDFSTSTSYSLICNVLDSCLKFDAVQASNDEAAVGVLRAFKERGIRVPEDIVICGFDNLFPSTLVEPAITTINVPRFEMGVAAIDECIRHIDDPELPYNSTVLGAEMLIRSSSEKGSEVKWDVDSW